MFVAMPVVVFQSRRDSYKYRVEECKLFLSISIKKDDGGKKKGLTLTTCNIL